MTYVTGYRAGAQVDRGIVAAEKPVPPFWPI